MKGKKMYKCKSTKTEENIQEKNIKGVQRNSTGEGKLLSGSNAKT